MVSRVTPQEPVEALTWALCASAGGSGPGKCDPIHCVCNGEARATLFALRSFGWDVIKKPARD